MAHKPPGFSLLVRLAMIPVALLVGAIGITYKSCLARLTTPCSSLIDDDQVYRLTGVRVGEIRVSAQQDGCSASYEDLFHRELLTVRIEKDTRPDLAAAITADEERLRLDRETAGVEHLDAKDGLDDGAFVAEIHAASRFDVLRINRAKGRGFLEVVFRVDAYNVAFARADARKFVPILAPQLPKVDAYLAKVNGS